LEAKAGHQTLLIEHKGIDAAMYRVCGEAPGHPFIHDDNARAILRKSASQSKEADLT